MSDDPQNQNYRKTKVVEGKGKVISSGKLPAEAIIKGGGMSTSGPTGSSRTYAKGSSVRLDPSRLSPMNSKTMAYPGSNVSMTGI